MDFWAGLAQFHDNIQKTAAVLAIAKVNIEGVHIDEQVHLDQAFEEAKIKFEEVCRFAMVNYDLLWLRDQVLEKIKQCDPNSKTINLENRCCSDNNNCPRMTFMKIFLEKLKFPNK